MVVKLPASAKEPVPNVKDEPEPVVVSNVPDVGNVTDVDPVKVAVKGDAPEKVKFPPMVMMLEPLFTPVPPCAGLINEVELNSVPEVGNVTFVAPVTVIVVA